MQLRDNAVANTVATATLQPHQCIM